MTTAMPIELQGTVAQRIAAVRGDAEFALWAVQHGADWKAVWSRCPRADWLLEAVLVTECREHGCATHRAIVDWLVVEVGVAVRGCDWQSGQEHDADRCRQALDRAREWVQRKLPDFAAFPMVARFPREVAQYDARTSAGERATMTANAAVRTLASALDPVSPLYAVRSLARVLGGELVNEQLALRFANRFECPVALRCDLPS